MYPHYHEEVAWQRLKDLQREMENGRQMADGVRRSGAALWLLAQRAWLLAGLATRRPPRANPACLHADGTDGCISTEVA